MKNIDKIAVFILIGKACFCQDGNSISISGSNNNVSNNQVNGDAYVNEIYLCNLSSSLLPGNVVSVDEFVSRTVWCMTFLKQHGEADAEIDKEVSKDITDLQGYIEDNSAINKMTEIIALVKKAADEDVSLPTDKMDDFRNKFATLKSYRILNCNRGSFHLKKSSLSSSVYFETSDDTSVDLNNFQVFGISEGMRRIMFNGKYGFSDNDTAFVIRPLYSEAYDFSDGLALVRNNNESEFINKKGSVVLKLKSYKRIWSFKEGMAKVQMDDNTFNYINKRGDTLFDYNFINADDFCNGLACVTVDLRDYFHKKIGGRWHVATQNILSKIDPFPDFNKGFIKYSIKWKRLLRAKSAWRKYNPYGYNVIYQTGFIDSAGMFLILPNYLDGFSFNKDSIAVVECQNNKYYLIKRQGTIISNPYDSIKPIADGKYFLATNFEDTENPKYALFLPNGSPIEGFFESKPVIINDFILYNMWGSYGILSNEGESIISPQYDAITYKNTSIFDLKLDDTITTVYIGPLPNHTQIKIKEVTLPPQKVKKAVIIK